MYDVKTLPASPETARKLLLFSKLNGMLISDELKALASQGLLTPQEFLNSPITPSETQIKAIQYIKDWNYRTSLLYNGVEGKNTALLAARLNEQYPIVILTRTEKFSEWCSFASKVFPDKKINVHSFTKTKEVLPDNCHPSLTFQEDAEIFITNMASLMKGEMMDELQPKLIISDEFENGKSFGYSNSSYISGLLGEIDKVIMLQHTAFLAQDKMDTNTLLNFAFMNRNNHHLANVVQNVIIPGNNLLLSIDFGEDIVEKYYDRFDNANLLQLFGVCTHLVCDQERTSPVVNLRFYNDSIEKIKGIREGSKVKSSLRLHLQKEQETERLARKPMAEIMENFVDGGANDYALNELYTSEWCELKYKEIGRMFLNNYSNSSKRILFHATNPTLINTFTSIASSIIHYETAKSRNDALQKYCRVDKDVDEYYGQAPRFMIMGVNSMTNEDILRRTNYMIMAQYPSRLDDFARIIEVCAKYHITLVDVVLQGSFEEYLVNDLYRKLNI